MVVEICKLFQFTLLSFYLFVQNMPAIRSLLRAGAG
ncbi:hypothetical protein V474_13930 [Novosphingobium barchaimii LL02]|uniref:Transposase n=1 Tax=Novosphingobium barchaimii LL02 TaxID=1114963 RepID=A0A0J7XZH7_9SPHN|nr:hypothetical protein V474_13930 [Novosphingobium barchaimii LL02]